MGALYFISVFSVCLFLLGLGCLVPELLRYDHLHWTWLALDGVDNQHAVGLEFEGDCEEVKAEAWRRSGSYEWPCLI